MKEPINVVVIDEAAMFRQLLIGWLKTADHFRVVGDGTTIDEAPGLLANKDVELLIVDWIAGDGSALRAITKITEDNDKLRVLVISASFGPSASDLFAAGIHGFVQKTEGLERLLFAMETVVGGGACFSSQDRLGRVLSSNALTERQQQILRLIINGLSTKEISSRLNISCKTAAHHRTRLMKKVGAHDTVSLMRYGLRSGLVQL